MSVETHQFYQNLLDPVSQEIMVDAVTLNCGHTVSQKTADVCIQQGLPCPVDHEHPVSSFVPSLITRELVQLAAHPAHPVPVSPAQKNSETIERLMSEQQQKVLFENTARAIETATKEIKIRHIGNCMKADPAYGNGVAAALGIPLNELG